VKTCLDCRYYTDCAQYKEYVVPTCSTYIPWRKADTNADKIRHMSDEELADFLADWARKHLAWMQDDRGEVLWWLQQNI
jgi:hypothetical protein